MILCNDISDISNNESISNANNANDNVTYIEKIAILTRLVLEFSEMHVVNAIRVAKDLSRTLDELRLYNVNLNSIESEFINLFSFHLRDRFRFLQIITNSWPNILKDLNIDDTIVDYNSVDNIQCNGYAIDVSNIKSELLYGEFNNSTEEIKFIAHTCKRYINIDKTISIISPSSEFTELLYNQLKFQNIVADILFDNFDRDAIEDFFNDKQIQNAAFAHFISTVNSIFCKHVGKQYQYDNKHIIAILLDYFRQDYNKANNITITTPSRMHHCQDEIIIMCMLNDHHWGCNVNGEYWLNDSLRKKLHLPTLDDYRNALIWKFHKSLQRQGQSYMLYSKSHLGKTFNRSAIYVKLEALCEKSNIPVKTITIEQDAKNTNNIANRLLTFNAFIPQYITCNDLSLLLQNEHAFFSKHYFKIDDQEQCNDTFSHLYRTLMTNYFCGCNDQKLMYNLEQIKQHNYFRYKQCSSLINTIKNSKDPKYSCNASHNERIINIAIYSTIAVNIKVHYSKTYANEVFYFCHDLSLINTKDFTSNYSSMMLTYLAAKQKNNSIDSVFVVDLNHKTIGKIFPVSQDDIDTFISTIQTKLHQYLNSQIILDTIHRELDQDTIEYKGTRYQHFLRRL